MLSKEKPNENERLQAVRAAYIQPSTTHAADYTTTNDSALAAVSFIAVCLIGSSAHFEMISMKFTCF